MKNNVNIYLADELHPAGIDLLKKNFNVFSLLSLTNPFLLKQLRDLSPKNGSSKDALIVRSVRTINRDFLEKAAKSTNINLICTVSAGFDNLDTIAAAECGIDVMNVAGANSTSAAEFTIGLILAAAKNLIPANNEMHRGTFDYSKYSNTELFGTTLGIIGVGRIGSKVAKLAKAFGMNILGNDINSKLKNKYPFVKFVSLDKILSLSDILTLHTPLDDSTHYIINKRNIALMKKEAILINTSRGGVIEEAALISSMKSNKLRYACVDVFENEPGFNKKLLKYKNLIITPHLAGKTAESKLRMGTEAAKKVIEYFSKTRRSHKLID
ncbi:MAG: hydroxyacid dehydrogenase [Ignavibacteria bacterium]|nr:hydroxyacid dehydrogenase [Ignavibacteria bacterium]